MKEFSEDIEGRMGKAFRSKAGKKFGLSDIELEMRRAQSNTNFGKLKDSVKDVDNRASKYLQNFNVNAKFLRKNIVN